MRVAIMSDAIVCAFAASLCVSAMADDAVGVFRVEAPSNWLTAVAMPFEPLSADGVGRFLSGGFAVGEDGRPDRLYQVSSRDGTVAESVWSGGAWLDAKSGATSAVRVTAGDALAFLPGLPEPTSLYVFGRVPCSGSLASTLFPEWNLLSYGYPAPASPFPSLPDGVAGPFGAEGCAATGAVPWRSVFWVSNSNDAAVGWSRPRPYGPLASGKPRIVGMDVDPGGQSVALDGNGCHDWRDGCGARSSGFENLPYESFVSPLCVEGHDLWRDILEVSAESAETNAVYAVTKTVSDGFYADVPLSETGVTQIALVDRAISNAFDVVWRTFDTYDARTL